MNEPIPEPAGAPAPIPAPVAAYKDRSTGLVIFGILTILMGCVAALIALLSLAGFAIAAKNPNVPPTPPSTILLALFLYGGVAVGLIWLGIGSIMARRWARALLLIFSWGWLIIGVVMTIAMPIIMPKTFTNLPANPNGQPALPPGAITGMIVGMTLFFGFFFVLLPAVWIFFYRSPHVKATCEARDPVTRWTDACPLPVLGFCLWLWFAVPMFLLMPIIGHGVMPLFGMFVNGLPGSLLCVAMAALWAWCGWLIYKLDARGWWLILIVLIIFTASSVLTYSRHTMLELYQQMGYPQAQIDQMQKMGFFTSHWMVWLMLFSMVPFLGYLLFIKKYLQRKA
jgi:hypothetical protein